MTDLPLFVLALMIFQRFTPRVLGMSQLDTTTVKVGDKTFFVKEASQHFQLQGRRTFGTPASLTPLPQNGSSNNGGQTVLDIAPPPTTTDQPLPIPEDAFSIPSSPLPGIDSDTENIGEKAEGQVDPGTNAQPQLQALDEATKVPKAEEQSPPEPEEEAFFFKQCWTESTRDKEFDIIETAHSRAEELLKEYSWMVTDHLPKVEASEASNVNITSVFRVVVNKDGGLESMSEADIEKRGRVRVRMVSKKLKPITGLEPNEFWKVFWDIVRCTCFIFPFILS